MKILKKTNNFLLILIINGYLFYLVNSKYPNLVIQNLDNLKDLLDRIQFTQADNISTNFYTVLIALISHALILIFYNKSKNQESILNVLFDIGISIVVFMSSFLFVLYLFRFNDFPRVYFILYIFISPVLFFLMNFFQKILINKQAPLYMYILTLLTLTFTFFAFASYTQVNEITTITLSENLQAENTSPQEYELNLTDNRDCFVFAGTETQFNCSVDAVTTLIKKYDYKFNNIIKHNNELYVLTKDGKVFEFENDNLVLKYDFSSKVSYIKDGYSEMGLLSLAFHPNENYFMMSYTNNEVSLVLEKNHFDRASSEIISTELVYSIPTNVGGHYSGSVIWSNYFQGFLFAIGDMESSDWGAFASDPLDTSNPKGKVLLFGNDIQTDIPKITLTKNAQNLKNIIAYGFRNPWQIFEFDNKLFIPDVGLSSYEELNILDYLNNASGEKFKVDIYGWPLYEGNKFVTNLPMKNKSQLINNHNLELNLHNESESFPAFDYIVANTTFPNFYYDHNPSETSPYYRAAIIGADIFTSPQYGTRYVFTDYMSKELFLYDFENNHLDIFMMPEIQGQPVAIKTYSVEENTFIFATTAGEIYKIMIP